MTKSKSKAQQERERFHTAVVNLGSVLVKSLRIDKMVEALAKKLDSTKQGADRMEFSTDEIEEIIRQAYVTGIKDMQDGRLALLGYDQKERVKQISTEIEKQISSGIFKCH